MSPKIKIEIVEDEKSIAYIYKFKLENMGYDVQTASNGEEGLALAGSFFPDLILLDLRMPLMSGDRMLEQLRSTEYGSNIRVIILTNISKDEAPAILRFLDVDRYVVKAHHTPSQIVEIVREVLGTNSTN
jgi:two-component system alkaline phosphatase synthesis response regulator PhoP